MSLATEFVLLALDDLRREAALMKADAWRFIQMHAVHVDNGTDLYYSFMKDGSVRNYCIAAVVPDTPVSSITDIFLAAFVFENEARELFGVNMQNIAIDFDGRMYNPAEAQPMTIISPELKAAKEKARKVAAAKAAKQKDLISGASDSASTANSQTAQAVVGEASPRIFVMTPELQARLDAKMPSLSPEKAQKVKAALEARLKEAEIVKAGVFENSADKSPASAHVSSQAASEQNSAGSSRKEEVSTTQAILPSRSDEDLSKLLSLMDEDKAKCVRLALDLKKGE